MLEVSAQSVEVVYKDIKNLHLSVHPPAGRVRVSAPLRFDEEAVRLAIVSRLPWIRRQQRRFLDQERQSLRDYVNGESHFLLGRRYRLRVAEDGGPEVRINGAFIELHMPQGSSRQQRETIVRDWYRRELKALLPSLVQKWVVVASVQPPEVRIRRMRTRWGSCNRHAQRVWLNLELVKKPPRCLEYVFVHELVHLKEDRHSERFQLLMDEAMPQWRTHRDELNQSPLAHEDWIY